MKNIKSQLIIGLVFVLLGILLSVQVKFSYKHFLVHKNRNFATLTYEVENLKKQKDENLTILQKRKNIIDKYEKNASKANSNVKALKYKIDEIKLISGQTNVHGEGIIIKVEPTKNYDGWAEPFASNLII